MALDFGNKVENNGATAQGRLSAEEFNTLVAQVNTNETNIGNRPAKDANTGRLDPQYAVEVMFNSMGSTFDGTDPNESYSQANNTTIFNPTTGLIVYKDNSGVVHSSDPQEGLIYGNKITRCLYMWNSTLRVMQPLKANPSGPEGVDFAQSIADLQSAIGHRLFFNGNEILENSSNLSMSIAEFIAATAGSGYDEIKIPGVVISLKVESTPEAWKIYQYNGGVWALASNWREIGEKPKIGNCYNVSANVPLLSGYYTLATATSATYDNAQLLLGMSITFESSNAVWKTYRYIGADLERTTFVNTSNWVDIGAINIRIGTTGIEISSDGGISWDVLITYMQLLEKTHVFCDQAYFDGLEANNQIDNNKIYMVYEND